MTNSKGYRRGTRDLFARRFRTHGMIPLSTYMRVYKIGEYVDIKVNSAAHKGMPHKVYHGKTGRVYNITPRALGVIVNKRVRNRILEKRINVRLEHVKPSKCRENFLQRVRENELAQKEDKLKGIKVDRRRRPEQPRAGHVVEGQVEPMMLTPIPYEFIA